MSRAPLSFVDPTGHAKYGGDDYDEADVEIWPLPDSVILVTVEWIGPGGTVTRRTLPGNVIGGNAILASDHSTVYGVGMSDLTRVTIQDTNGTVLHSAAQGEFVFAEADQEFGGRYDMYVFEESTLSDRVAPLGNAEELGEGQLIFQAVIKSPRQGLYETAVSGIGSVVDHASATENLALTVKPTSTVTGDSGSGLYSADGTLYGVLNAGDSVIATYGPITAPQYITDRAKDLWQHYFGYGR